MKKLIFSALFKNDDDTYRDAGYERTPILRVLLVRRCLQYGHRVQEHHQNRNQELHGTSGSNNAHGSRHQHFVKHDQRLKPLISTVIHSDPSRDEGKKRKVKGKKRKHRRENKQKERERTKELELDTLMKHTYPVLLFILQVQSTKACFDNFVSIRRFVVQVATVSPKHNHHHQRNTNNVQAKACKSNARIHNVRSDVTLNGKISYHDAPMDTLDVLASPHGEYARRETGVKQKNSENQHLRHQLDTSLSFFRRADTAP